MPDVKTTSVTTSSAAPVKCDSCSKPASSAIKLLSCSRCKKAAYCDKNCQATAWPSHKSSCHAANYILKLSLCRREITNPSVSRTLSCPPTVTFAQLHRAIQLAFGWANTHTYDFKFRDPNAEKQDEGSFSLASFIKKQTARDEAQMAGTSLPDFGPKENLLRIPEKEPKNWGMAGKIDFMHASSRRHSQTPEIFSHKIKLTSVLENPEYQNCEMEYEYDFGDCWVHEIKLLGRDEGEGRGKWTCIDGEGHGVAEDVGSVKGWLELRQAYRAARDPTRAQKEKMSWYEGMCSNGDVKGLGNGRDRVWDRDAVNAELAQL